MYFFYQTIVTLLLVISPVIISYRIFKNKEDKKAKKNGKPEPVLNKEKEKALI